MFCLIFRKMLLNFRKILKYLVFKLCIQQLFILTPEKDKENPPKSFSLCFDLDSALKTIDAQMSFRSVFLKTHIKKLLAVKNASLAIFGGY